MKFKLKRLRTFRGTDGTGFNVDLWVDGKKAAFVMNAGGGGMDTWEWYDDAVKQAVEKLVDALPPVNYPDLGDIPQDLDMWLGGLIDEYQTLTL